MSVAPKKWADLWVVAGPTASGKSEFGVALAEKWDAEIISADAYQVYRGLSRLTAQPTAEQQSRARHHLVNILDPNEAFSPADFVRLAEQAMKNIRSRGKRVVIVGGSGFYLEALLNGVPATPAPDPELRLRINRWSLDDMVAELVKHDPTAAETVDLKNPRRVQRALEICLITGQPFTSFAKTSSIIVPGVVLNPAPASLHARIEKRVTAMLELGAIDEVKKLGPSCSTSQKAIGLREIARYLNNEITLAECHEQIVISTRQYAKRQRTWFRNRSPWELVPPRTAMDYVSSILNLPSGWVQDQT